MSHHTLEDLEVYRLADSFSDEIWFLVSGWDYFTKDTVGKQIVRSADSISANIAEGYGRYHYKENRNFCYFSRGSILETKGWLQKSKKRNLITEEQFNDLFEKLQVIHIKLNAYLKFIGKRNGNDKGE
ncbi:four helix bundle protein [Mucilaginibacter gossypiicola]|uniref:Four helix bundle protein n=1 Tax=Mucilaginibacter gossypiicola TaxID=551995 RepID=A0A1H8PYG5_9SPHI|nr:MULTISPECIES: four helix bundle protein [Mucilaginibacter]UOE50218.1 four helix bundle protein [Mucilaginibacter sp. SMC90]SEO46778.1 four helix bundle protein [Mucilaginibacter gossypiicola]